MGDRVQINIMKRFEFDKEALGVVVGNAIRWGVQQELIYLDKDPDVTISPEEFGRQFVAFVQSSSGVGVASSGQFNYVEEEKDHEQDG